MLALWMLLHLLLLYGCFLSAVGDSASSTSSTGANKGYISQKKFDFRTRYQQTNRYQDIAQRIHPASAPTPPPVETQQFFESKAFGANDKLPDSEAAFSSGPVEDGDDTPLLVSPSQTFADPGQAVQRRSRELETRSGRLASPTTNDVTVFSDVFANITNSLISQYQVVYREVQSNTDVIAGGMNPWKRFHQIELLGWWIKADYIPTGIVYLSQSSRFVPPEYFNCSDPGAAEEIILSMLSASKSKSSVVCLDHSKRANHTWITKHCSSGTLALCVNCQDPCLAKCSDRRVMYPYELPCVGTMLSAKALGISFKSLSPVLPPYIVRVAGSVAGKTSVRASIDISTDERSQRTVLCGAAPSSETRTGDPSGLPALSRFQEVSSQGTIVIAGLVPSTNYTLHCLVHLNGGDHVGQVLEVQSRSGEPFRFRTACCKVITISRAKDCVSANDGSSELFSVEADYSPAVRVGLRTALVSSSSFVEVRVTTTPTLIEFTAWSQPHSRVPVYVNSVEGVPHGNYDVDIHLEGPSQDEFELDFSAKTVTVVSAPSNCVQQEPKLVSCELDSTGTKLIAQFDADAISRVGQEKYNQSARNCSGMFVVPSRFRECNWISPRSLVVLLGPPPTVQVDDSFSFVGTAGHQSVKITADPALMKPQAVLVMPSLVSRDENIPIDLLSSRGSGARAWSSVNISIEQFRSRPSPESDCLTLARQHLTPANEHKSTAQLLYRIIPAGTLNIGKYIVEATVCNFLRFCATDRQLLTVVDAGIHIPAVQLRHDQYFQLKPRDPLVFSAAILNGRTNPDRRAEYVVEWLLTSIELTASDVTLNRDRNYTTADSENSAFVYSLGPYSLRVGTYVLSAEIRSMKLWWLAAALRHVVIHVVDGGVVAVIQGSSVRSVRQGGSITLDASSSFDSSSVETLLEYKWRCLQIRPYVEEGCQLTITASPNINSSAYAQSIVSVTAGGNQSLNTTNKLFVTVARTRGGTSALPITEATAAVDVVIVSAEAPLLTVLAAAVRRTSSGTAQAVFSCAADIAAVDGTAPVTVSWLAVSPGTGHIGSTASLLVDLATPVPYVLDFDVVLPWSLLPSHSHYQFMFQLDATGLLNEGTVFHSGSAITAVPKRPPSSGSLVVVPDAGVAYVDDFTFVATYWLESCDDSEYLPLSYSFGVVITEQTVVLFEEKYAVGMLTHQTKLPLGRAARSFADNSNRSTSALECIVLVRDSIGGVSNATYEVHSMPPAQDARRDGQGAHEGAVLRCLGHILSDVDISTELANCLALVSLPTEGIDRSSPPGTHIGCNLQLAILVKAASTPFVVNSPEDVTAIFWSLRQLIHVLPQCMQLDEGLFRRLPWVVDSLLAQWIRMCALQETVGACSRTASAKMVALVEDIIYGFVELSFKFAVEGGLAYESYPLSHVSIVITHAFPLYPHHLVKCSTMSFGEVNWHQLDRVWRHDEVGAAAGVMTPHTSGLNWLNGTAFIVTSSESALLCDGQPARAALQSSYLAAAAHSASRTVSSSACSLAALLLCIVVGAVTYGWIFHKPRQVDDAGTAVRKDVSREGSTVDIAPSGASKASKRRKHVKSSRAATESASSAVQLEFNNHSDIPQESDADPVTHGTVSFDQNDECIPATYSLDGADPELHLGNDDNDAQPVSSVPATSEVLGENADTDGIAVSVENPSSNFSLLNSFREEYVDGPVKLGDDLDNIFQQAYLESMTAFLENPAADDEHIVDNASPPIRAYSTVIGPKGSAQDRTRIDPPPGLESVAPASLTLEFPSVLLMGQLIPNWGDGSTGSSANKGNTVE
jgi:hypothetical protein